MTSQLIFYFQVQLKELSQPKRAVMHRIDSSTKEIQDASESLQKPFFEDGDTVARDDLVRCLFSLKFARPRQRIQLVVGCCLSTNSDVVDETPPRLEKASTCWLVIPQSRGNLCALPQTNSCINYREQYPFFSAGRFHKACGSRDRCMFACLG